MIRLPTHPRTADAVDLTSEKDRADPAFLTNLINALLNSFIAFREISGKRFNGDKAVRAFNDYAQYREAVILYVRGLENQSFLYAELKEHFEQRLRDARASYGFPATTNSAGDNPDTTRRLAVLESIVGTEAENSVLTEHADELDSVRAHRQITDQLLGQLKDRAESHVTALNSLGGRIAALEGLPALFEAMHDRHESLVTDMQGMLGSLQRLWKLSAGEDGLGGFVLRMNTVERQLKVREVTTDGRLEGILERLAALEDGLTASYHRIMKQHRDMEYASDTKGAADAAFEVPPLALGADPDATAVG